MVVKYKEVLKFLDDWKCVSELMECLRSIGFNMSNRELRRTLEMLAFLGVVERSRSTGIILYKRKVKSKTLEKKTALREAILEVLNEVGEATTGELYSEVRKRTMRDFTMRYLLYLLSEMERNGLVVRKVVSFGRRGRTSVVRLKSPIYKLT